MDHFSVELPELIEHHLVFFIGKVGSGCPKDHLVLLYDMYGIEVDENTKLGANVCQIGCISISIASVGFNESFNRMGKRPKQQH
jgi:hypothetical protein